MKSFLLAAGLGSRLRPLTDTLPKCLLPIGGKPLLRIWLEHLKAHGIGEVLINTHWLSGKVDAFVKTFKLDGLSVSLFHEPVLLGSAGTLFANRGWLDASEPFLIVYGDNLTNVDLGRMISYHRSHGLPFTLGVFETDNPAGCGIVEAADDGTVTGFVEKPAHPRSCLAAAGVYVADKRLFDFFPRRTGRPLDLGFHVIPNLVRHMKIFPITDLFIDIGTVHSYERAQRLWEENQRDQAGV